ncbi:hypothetical protein ACLK19_23845 [Escherichia coli]
MAEGIYPGGTKFSLWPAGQPTTTVTTTGGTQRNCCGHGGAPVVGDMPAQTAPPDNGEP